MLNSLKLWAGVALVIIALGWLVLHKTERGAQTSMRAEIAENAVSEAAAERKADLKADAQVASKNRVALDSARRASIPARKHIEETAKQGVRAGCEPLADPEWGRVFNATLTASREAVEAARSMP